MSKEIRKLGEDILNGKYKYKPYRLILFDDTDILIIYNGHTQLSSFKEMYVTRNLKLKRGDILSLFSKIEFFINELIQINISYWNSEKSPLIDDLLENLDLFTRVNLLNRWGVIDNKTLDLFNKLKKVRNSFAHVWNIEEIEYKKRKIRDSFDEFKEDLEKIWLFLSKRLQEDMGPIEEIKKRFETMNSEDPDEII